MANLAIAKNIVQDLVMAVDRSAPIVDDPWLGPLWRYNDHELIGWITIDPAVRHARHDGSTDAEVLLNIGTFPQPSADLDARVSVAAQRIKTALANLDAIKQFGIEFAPAGWRDHYEPQTARPLIDRLFADGFEVDEELDVAVVFDFEDLDNLIVWIDANGRGTRVDLR